MAIENELESIGHLVADIQQNPRLRRVVERLAWRIRSYLTLDADQHDAVQQYIGQCLRASK